MGKREITRRQVLAGVAGVGSTGTALGTGTGAILSDEEVFSKSGFTSGKLDLDVHWKKNGGWIPSDDGEISPELEFGPTLNGLTVEEDGEGEGVNSGNVNPSGEGLGVTGGWEYESKKFDVKVSLPDGDNENNPGYVWVGSTCPESDLAKELEITISYEDSGDEVFKGSLKDLAGGKALDGDTSGLDAWNDRGCLKTGEKLKLTVEVDPGEFDGESTDAFTLQFEARQCRNTSDETNPFQGDSNCGDEGTDSEDGISFIAFCSSDEGSIDPDLEIEETDDGEPIEVEWDTEDHDMDFVIVKASTDFILYDLKDDEERTEGTVSVDDSGSGVEVVDAHPKNGESHPSRSSDPCGLAAEKFGYDDYEAISSIKLEEDGDWEVEEEED